MPISPMFSHALESFEHGLEHYGDGTPRGRKFALLHIDQAIELVLKEKCARLGKSIYKSDGTTLTFHEAAHSVSKERDLPELPRLQDLHDLRNTIQHKGLTPDPLTTEYHVVVAYEFLRRFLPGELNTPLQEIVGPRLRAMIEGPPTPVPPPAEIIDALRLARETADPTARIFAGFTVAERAAAALTPPGEPLSVRKSMRPAAELRGIPKATVKAALAHLHMLRGKVVNSAYVPTELEADAYLENVASLLQMIGYQVRK